LLVQDGFCALISWVPTAEAEGRRYCCPARRCAKRACSHCVPSPKTQAVCTPLAPPQFGKKHGIPIANQYYPEQSFTNPREPRLLRCAAGRCDAQNSDFRIRPDAGNWRDAARLSRPGVGRPSVHGGGGNRSGRRWQYARPLDLPGPWERTGAAAATPAERKEAGLHCR